MPSPVFAAVGFLAFGIFQGGFLNILIGAGLAMGTSNVWKREGDHPRTITVEPGLLHLRTPLLDSASHDVLFQRGRGRYDSSEMEAIGAFVFTDSMPLSRAGFEAYISLRPITCRFAALRTK